MRFADDYRPEDPDALPEGIAAWAKTQQGLCSSTEVAP
jgi:hypothetical protein